LDFSPIPPTPYPPFQRVGFLRTRKERQGGIGVGIEQGRITVQEKFGYEQNANLEKRPFFLCIIFGYQPTPSSLSRLLEMLKTYPCQRGDAGMDFGLSVNYVNPSLNKGFTKF
jgi:hypothetical protein